MGINVQVTSHAIEVENALEGKKEIVLTAWGMAAEKNAKVAITQAVYDTPEGNYIRTGNLRNSLTYETDDDSMYVGTNVEYGIYVELGSSTAKRGPRPFVKPAIMDNLDEYRRIAEEYLRNE